MLVPIIDGTKGRQNRSSRGAGGSRLASCLLLDIIGRLPRIMGNPFVFAPSDRGAPPAFITRKLELNKMMREQVPDMKPWVLHDLRRTARSLMSRAGILPHIAEQVLGHAIRGVEGVYDRHSYDDEKADALNRLADLVARIVTPIDNVVLLRD